MANPADNSNKLPFVPFVKSHKAFLATQISLRVLATATTLAAAWITFTNNESITVFGILTRAKYSYSSAFRFFAYVDLIVCFFTLVSLLAAFMIGNKAVNPTKYFYMFLHDLTMTLVLMAGCAAATAVGQVGKYGNSHAGWMPICNYFVKYCKRGTVATLLAYIGMVVYVGLTVLSATNSRHITAV